MEVLAARVAVRHLGDADERDAGDAELFEHFAGDGQLSAAAVDQHEVGPRRELVARRVLLMRVHICVGLDHGELALGQDGGAVRIRAQHAERQPAAAPRRSIGRGWARGC